jgi:hypothetical protein
MDDFHKKGEKMIQLVRTDGMLLIGDLEMGRMKRPRALVIGRDGQLFVQELVGRPEEVFFDALPAIRYETPEKVLLDIYREAVSGIVIAQTVKGNNVIDIGRKK